MTTTPPPVGPNLQNWARATRAYLQRWLPRLQWKTADSNPSENGIILWDEESKNPIVSVDGVWEPFGLSNQNGVVDYNDTATATTPITLTTNTWTTLTNDGLGAFTNTTYAPEGSLPMLSGTGQIDISRLSLGSWLVIRPDYTVTPSSNNSSLEFRYQLGTGAGAYTLEKNEGRLDLGAGIPYRRALEAHFIYVGDANTRDNPITLQIKLSANGSVVNAGMAIGVVTR